MNRQRKKLPFEKVETGYHKYAVKELADWVEGVIEQPFFIGEQIAFVPDVACYKDGILDRIYEIVYKHPINGKKLGLMMDWCYRNGTEVSVFEVSADYVLSQKNKPEIIQTMEYYAVNPFNE